MVQQHFIFNYLCDFQPKKRHLSTASEIVGDTDAQLSQDICELGFLVSLVFICIHQVTFRFQQPEVGLPSRETITFFATFQGCIATHLADLLV